MSLSSICAIAGEGGAGNSPAFSNAPGLASAADAASSCAANCDKRQAGSKRGEEGASDAATRRP
eukprot:1697955-Prymnesium_polylepis.1